MKTNTLWPDKLTAILSKVRQEIAAAWFRGDSSVTITVKLR